MQPRVAIIVVNWNGKNDTMECLSSLHQSSYPSAQIIVVDNGSSDDSACTIAAGYPAVEVIEARENLGFTGGNNLGIERALELGCDYIFLLNNDTTVESDSIAVLVQAAEDNASAGLVTPVIHFFDHREEPWFAGSLIDLTRAEAVHDNANPPLRTDSPLELPWASGCAMLLPAAVMRALNGFDNRFFLNWEDVDLSLRVRRAGYKIFLIPSARIYHKVGSSIEKAPRAGTYYYVRNRLLLLRLHAGKNAWRTWVYAVSSCFRLAVRAFLRRREPRFYEFRAIMQGIRDGVIGRTGAADRLW